MLIPLLFALVFPACLIWAAISDIRSMTIANRLTVGLALAFLPVALPAVTCPWLNSVCISVSVSPGWPSV